MAAGSLTTVMRPSTPSPATIGSSKCSSVQVVSGLARTALQELEQVRSGSLQRRRRRRAEQGGSAEIGLHLMSRGRAVGLMLALRWGSRPPIRRGHDVPLPRRPRRTPTEPATRIETDTFGPIEVPADRYWGAQTQRSIAEFPHRRRADAGAAGARARAREAGGRAREQGPRAARAARRRRHRRRGRRRWCRANTTTSSRWSSGRPAPAPSRT